MFYCINNNHIVHINDYILESKMNLNIDDCSLESKVKLNNTPAICPFCGNELIVKAINSIEKTHFSHKPNQSCSYISYSEFFKFNGISKTNADIEDLKEDIILNSYKIFLKLKSEYIPQLDCNLFLKTLKKVANPKILQLRNLTCNHIPYIWLNELKKFDNKVYLYTNSERLHTSKINFNAPHLWNTTEKKDIIITAEEMPDKTISHTITPIDLNFLDCDIDFPYKFLSEITRLKIFDIFSLTSEKSELILKNLLNIAKQKH